MSEPVLVVEPGYVWCDVLGGIHDEPLERDGVPYAGCGPENHVPIYVKRDSEGRAVK